MKLSVIILNYNVRYFLEQCIHSVKAAIAQIDAEIIVVDNNSPDDSIAMVKDKFPDITLIANKENVGFAKANNQAVQVAKGTYICILNPDTVVGEDTFVKAMAFARSKTQCGIVGVKLIDGTGNFLPESKRRIPTPSVALGKMLSLKRNIKYYASHLNENESGEVEVLVGAFMLLKKAVYQEVGGFDERYFMYGEDIDLSYTIKKAGYINYYFAETSVIHYKGESTARDYDYVRRFSKAMKLFYRKHYRGSFLTRIAIYLGAAIFSLLKASGSIKTKAIGKKPKKQICLSNKTERVSLLREKLGVDFKNYTAPSQIDRHDHCRDELIIDGESFSHIEVIETLEQFKNTDLTFRIWPKDCNFIIGSDSSDGRGDVNVF